MVYRGLLEWLAKSWGRSEKNYGPMDGNGFMDNEAQYVKIVKAEIISSNGVVKTSGDRDD